MLKQYKTILNQAQAEIIEKKSRFIATVRPVKQESDAKAFIEEMKKKYWDATHNVFAYQIGERDEIQKCSDDGEPQGTAGMPVLDVLKKEEIKNTAIVVTRYFGGTLLGTGGLVRAYGKSAKEGLLAAGISQLILYRVFSISTDYTLSGKIQFELIQNQFVIQDTIYTEKVEYLVLAETERQEELKKRITEISSAKAEILEREEKYGVWTEGILEMLE